jgi:hypothetical protein
MDKNQDWVIPISPAHIHDLVRAAKDGFESFLNSIRRDDPVEVCDKRASGCVGIRWRR